MHLANEGCKFFHYVHLCCFNVPFFYFDADKLTSYGPIVKEHFLWNYPVIHLYDKKDIEDVLKYPSKYPIRPDLEVQCVYRRSCPEKYSSVGMVNA